MMIFEAWEADASQRGLEAQKIRRKREASPFVVTNIQWASPLATLCGNVSNIQAEDTA
jgi:hypothetical protein